MGWKLYPLLILFAVSVSCTKSVSSTNIGPGTVVTSSTGVTCQYLPTSFQLLSGTQIIPNYSPTGGFSLGYQCMQNGAVIPSAQCEGPNATSFSSCSGSGSISLSGLSTGFYTVNIYGVDPNTGSVTSTLPYTFAIDLVPPLVTSASIGTVTTNSFTLNIQASDPTTAGGVSVPSSGVASLQCALSTSSTLPANPTWTPCNYLPNVASFSNLQPATNYWVFFWLQDLAGNSNLSMSGIAGTTSIEVTTTTPTVVNTGSPGLCTINLANPTYFTPLNSANPSSPIISYSCPNTQLQNQCQLTGPTDIPTGGLIFENCDQTQRPYLNLPDGYYQFCVANAAGVPANLVACSNFTIDTHAPTVTLNNPSVGAASALLTYSGQDATSGINYFSCALVHHVLGSNDQVFNGAGQLQSGSVTSTLANPTNKCGQDSAAPNSTAAQNFTSTQSYQSPLLSVGEEYTFYVEAFDYSGQVSTVADTNFVPGVAGVSCQITSVSTNGVQGALIGGAFRNTDNLTFSYSCSAPPDISSLNFLCSVTDLGPLANNLNGATSAGTCVQTSGPTCSSSSCVWTGTFNTSYLGSPLNVGDDYQISIQADGIGAFTGLVVAQSNQATDSFRYNNLAPVLNPNSINVYVTNNSALITYSLSEPTNEGGLAAGQPTCSILAQSDCDAQNVSATPVMTLPASECSTTTASFPPSTLLNYSSEYCLELSAQDNAGNLSVYFSPDFYPPYPYAAPTCQLYYLGSDPPTGPRNASILPGVAPTQSAPQIVDPSNPLMQNSWVEIQCVSPSPGTASLVTCRTRGTLTNGQAVTNPTFAQCGSMTGSLPNNDTVRNSTNNTVFASGLLTMDVQACDTYDQNRCTIYSLPYYIGIKSNGGWSSATTVTRAIVFPTTNDTITQVSQKLCTNPVSQYTGSDCVQDSGYVMLTNYYSYQSTTVSEEYKATGVCNPDTKLVQDTYTFNSTAQYCEPSCSGGVRGTSFVYDPTTNTCVCQNSSQQTYMDVPDNQYTCVN